MRFTHAILAFSLILAACADDNPEQQSDGSGVAMDHVATSPAAQKAVAEEALSIASAPPPPAASPMPRGAAAQGPGSSVAFPDSLRTPMLIRNGEARVEVASLEPAVAKVKALAAQMGGYVTNVMTLTGEENVRQSTLTLRIPAARFDAALEGLSPLGKVESVNVSSEDVGEEYVDVGVRLENGRRMERRLLDLLETRTGKLEEVLAVERELARVREEIERLEGRMRFLRDRAAVSTLTVTVHEPAPLLSEYGTRNVVAHAFVQAWRNFIRLVTGLIASLGVLLPIAVVAGAVWLFVRRRSRHV